ncbi:type 1 glutamine amidotransferase [Ethanoligenens sp.]|uniref:type 1 glutamine amidotransferase n=1 Tax=Ethanoligenens sp. TaxID=2099655 RepID=UPI0039E95000
MKIHYLQHIALETPGCILDWAAQRGHTLTRTAFFAQESLPDLQDFQWLIIMGGPMNIYEEQTYPWLKLEKAFIRAAVDAGKTVLGFCLGGQLAADALGGKVTRGAAPEIGWQSIHWNETADKDPLFAMFPKDCTVFQWHYDTFSALPPEATVLASSPACAHQVFVWGGRVFGFQFHLENTEEMLRGYIEAGAAEMVSGPTIQTPRQVLAYPEHIAQTNAWIAAFLTALERRTAASL